MPTGKYMRQGWTAEIQQYIKDTASPKIKINRMVEMVNEKFGTSYEREQIKGFIYRNHLPFANGYRHNLLLTDEQAEYLASIIPGRLSDECARMMNEKYGLNLNRGQIRSWKKNHKVQSGYDTRWRKGQKPWITGMKLPGRTNRGTYTNGHISANNLPIGTERTHDGRIYVKVQDGCLNDNWKRKDRIVWEAAHGEMPEDMVIVHLDRDPMNCELDNLMLISRTEHVLSNTQIGLSNDPEINKVVYTISKLKTAMRRK